MKRTVIAAVVLLLAFAAPVIAVEGVQPPQGMGSTFEQKQADILKRLDIQIASAQHTKGCIQKAKNDEDIKACLEKRRAEMLQLREKNQKPGGPGAPSAPSAPGVPALHRNRSSSADGV